MGYKKVFPNKQKRDRDNLNSHGFDNVKPEKPVGAKPGWSTDYSVQKTLVGRHGTVQMTAVVTAMETGVPMTFRQIWEKAQEIHRVGDRTVRQHLQRMIEDGRVVRLEAPAFSPLYVIAGAPPRQWYRCRDCSKVTATDVPLEEEIDIGMVDGAYMWGTCRECIDSGVEVVVSGLGNRLVQTKTGSMRGATGRSMDHVRPPDDPGSEAMTHYYPTHGGPRLKKDKEPE